MQKGGRPTTSARPSSTTLHFRELDAEPTSDDRYARQKLVPWWNQRRLASAHVVVVGAGALGNEAIKNLALLGVGSILIVDFDRVEASNLSRCLLFNEQDIGASKAQAAARAAAQINPEITVAALDGDIEHDLGEGELRTYDLVLGCVDSIAARWAINRLCHRAGVPWLNSGIGAAMGEVSFYDPNTGPCYEGGMPRSMWHRMNQRRSCLMVGDPAEQPPRPATALLASMTAGLQVQEAVHFLHREVVGCPQRLQPGQMVALNTQPYSLTVMDGTANTACLAHEERSPALPIRYSPHELTVRKLLDAVLDSTAWILDFDVVTALECAACGQESMLLPLRRLRAEMLRCPQCRGQRVPTLAHEVAAGSPLTSMSLAQFGVPHQAILKVKTARGVQRMELTVPRAGAQVQPMPETK